VCGGEGVKMDLFLQIADSNSQTHSFYIEGEMRPFRWIRWIAIKQKKKENKEKNVEKSQSQNVKNNFEWNEM